MSVNEDVHRQLLDMGLDPAKSRQAALRYHTVDAAINWVFGEGENWRPEEEIPSYESYPSAQGYGAPASTKPQMGSNNPFLNAPQRPNTPHDSEYDELQRAIGLSRQSGEDNAERNERERSVRASAPPPSPRRNDDDEVWPIDPLFGPSNKDDPEGQLAMVPAAPQQSNKEEEDFQRAIQESMMTASFQSIASEPAIELPPATGREPGAPLVYVTAKQPHYTANVLQALAAVPQLREVFAGLGRDERDTEAFHDVQDLFAMQDSAEVNYRVVDQAIKDHLDNTPESNITPPPVYPIIEVWLPALGQILNDRHYQKYGPEDDVDMDVPSYMADFERDHDRLLNTFLHSRPHSGQTHVRFDRSMTTPTDIHTMLANVIWSLDAPGESIDKLADIIFVIFVRQPGVDCNPWQMEEEVVLDRYLTHNAQWAAQKRAQQALLQGELRRLREQIESLTVFRGHSLPDNLKVLVKHLADSGEEDKEKLKAKLERIAAALEKKLTSLRARATELEEEARSHVFDTDDPDKTQHKYRLRSVLWHDGFLTPGKHLFAYVNHNDAWWRVQDTEARKVEWTDVQSDPTGHFTDGGPYLLVYSRDGPRPKDPAGLYTPTGTSGSSVCEDTEIAETERSSYSSLQDAAEPVEISVPDVPRASSETQRASPEDQRMSPVQPASPQRKIGVMNAAPSSDVQRSPETQPTSPQRKLGAVNAIPPPQTNLIDMDDPPEAPDQPMDIDGQELEDTPRKSTERKNGGIDLLS